MIDRKRLFDWSLFSLLAMLFCFLLSWRPIPSQDSLNDTVRYVQRLQEYCTSSVEEGLLHKQVSYDLFFAVTSPACFFQSNKFFLFETAIFLPLVFLLFSRWRAGTFVWACCLMFSVFGLELMTNAMRQNFAMLVFFSAVAALERSYLVALLLGLVAASAHISALAFLPLLIWMGGSRFAASKVNLFAATILIVSLVVGYVYRELVTDFFGVMEDLGSVYAEIYSKELKVSFILFMVLPLYGIYGVRYLVESASITNEEKRALAYSTATLLVSYLVFPYITYRFAIFSVVLQLFLATRSQQQGVLAAGYVFGGLFLHLLLIMAVSDHYTVLLYG